MRRKRKQICCLSLGCVTWTFIQVRVWVGLGCEAWTFRQDQVRVRKSTLTLIANAVEYWKCPLALRLTLNDDEI